MSAGLPPQPCQLRRIVEAKDSGHVGIRAKPVIYHARYLSARGGFLLGLHGAKALRPLLVMNHRGLIELRELALQLATVLCNTLDFCLCCCILRVKGLQLSLLLV